jgi:xylulokinase
MRELTGNSGTYLLGFDVGTQGAKALLVRADGLVLGQGYSSYSTDRPREGYAEQDPEQTWWTGCQKAIAEAVNQAHIDVACITAIGFSSQTSNIVLLDKKGAPLRPAIIWQDQRSADVAEQINKMLTDAGFWTRRHFPLTAHSYLAPLLWLRENESEAFGNAVWRLTTSEYILFRLTGRKAVDPAVASGMLPLYSLEGNGWDRRICDLLSIPKEDLPEILPPHSMAGTLLPRAAEQLGLPSGIPVMVGTADSMADLLSAGVFSPGQTAFTYGTLLGIAKCLPGLLPDFFCFRHSIDHSYLLFGGVPLAGATLNWFRENLAQAEQVRAKESGESAYDLLSLLGQAIPPGCDGLFSYPFSEPDGRETATNPGAAVLGLNLRHTRGHLYRSMIEGIAFDVRRQLEEMAGPTVTEITAIGGGTRDALWTQVMSDVLGMVQHIPTIHHGAPLGDAFLAGWGCGIFSDIEQIQNWLRPMKVVRPNKDSELVYQKMYDKYLRMGESLGIIPLY